MKLNTQPKLELLQVVRAIAALAVVFYHTGYQPDYGAYGVWVFFVLSGVIMGMLMESEKSASQFILRRMVRIVPLYWIITTLTAFITWFAPNIRVSGNAGGVKEYLFSLFFIPFRDLNGNILPMLSLGWTLNYEIAFYLTCAANLFLTQKWPHRITALLVVLWWCLAHLSPTDIGFFYASPIVFLFILGLGLWSLSQRINFRAGSYFCMGLIPLASIVLAYLEWLGNRQRGSTYTVAGKISLTVFIVWLGIVCEPAFQRLKDAIRRPLIVVGDASYAIYLTHIFVIRLFNLTLPNLGLSREGLPLAFICLIFSTLVGIVVHRYIDTPIQKKLKQLIPNR
jgi:exopolysaccharide production protein ExoZ